MNYIKYTVETIEEVAEFLTPALSVNFLDEEVKNICVKTYTKVDENLHQKFKHLSPEKVQTFNFSSAVLALVVLIKRDCLNPGDFIVKKSEGNYELVEAADADIYLDSIKEIL